MSPLFIILFAISFGVLAIINFRVAAFFLICLFPAYLIRFDIGPLPSTALEVSFGIFFAVWLLKYGRTDQRIIRKFFKGNRWFAVAGVVFFAASVISIFTSDMWWYSFGQWRAYFFEPMLLFIIFIGRREILKPIFLMVALSFSTFSIAIFGIFQKFSGWTLPSDGRVTSFFTSPNAVGLYLGPILIFTIFLLIQSNQKIKKIIFSYNFLILILGLTVIFYTRSLGTVLALTGGLLLLLWLLNKRKLAVSLLILMIAAGLFLPPLRNFITSKDQSSGNRLILWQYSMEYLTASPNNFIFGTGIRQFFRKIQKPHYNPKEIERLIYPHDIFLNFWTETGLLGMLSFVFLYGSLMIFAIRVYNRDRKLGACLVSALTVLFLHGLIDVPYFKNDLAMLFWAFAALIANTATI